MVTDAQVRATSRRLRDLVEPIAANVYFAKEAQEDFWSVFEREFRRAYATGQGASPAKS